ncbi:HAMP domain-containing sensor histidine kinase [Asticcacaulis sp.]|uniref:sensor histidine kinase n=1 Tax=Asticcacaulis sp. TaxID=1872648 RepID=UPI002CB2CC53|nr:HAMP domain-containing sensor histidine kinase [Asticcacaulis sp.]HTM80132.1 HAMP domain-containing sensor histidine kinase [Asticcacaulis sp.]
MIPLLRSIGFAVMFRVAGATLAICAVMFALVYALLATQSRASLVTTIDTDMAGLVDIYAAEGQGGLIRRLDDRLSLMPRAAEMPYYLLAGPDGRALSGNIARLPALDAGHSGVGTLTLPSGEHILARATRLKNGLTLVTGRSVATRDAALNTVALTFTLALCLIAVSAFWVGLMAAGGLKRRVMAINTVFGNVQNGQLSARIPVSDPGNELDHLAGNVNTMLERLEALITAQRDVTENIAHETRTPLMRLDASLMTAQQNAEDPGMADELEKSRSHIKGILRLFDALLDIASAKARRGDAASLHSINLSVAARSLMDLYQASAEEAGITLESRIADNVCQHGDVMQMSRLMVNLLDNAFKYGGDGGFVRFTLAPGPVITVEDHGDGIPEDERDLVFQRFHRSASGQPGHGLGLALVSAIAARHDLTVRIEDTQPDAPRKGARFIVSAKEV